MFLFILLNSKPESVGTSYNFLFILFLKEEVEIKRNDRDEKEHHKFLVNSLKLDY